MRNFSFRSRLIATTTLVAAGLLGAGTALAAEPAPALTPTSTTANTGSTAVETVVVTGSRKIVTPPKAIKHEQTAIVDSVTATELDRIPDQSLAEALDRVAGVSSDVGYNSSQARTVTIRGFDARYDSMEVDGNPIWNSSRNNRGTQLDIFPATAVSQVNVFKVVNPDQDANSIGGHIELRTLRAFDGGTQPYFSMKAQAGDYEQNGLTEGNTPSYLVSMVGKRTFGSASQFGVVLGADLQRDRFYDRYNTVGAYSQINGVDVPNGDLFTGTYDETVTRQSLYAKLEAHATDKLYAFVFASYFRERNDENIYRTGPYLVASTITGASEGAGSFTKSADEGYLETYNLDRKSGLFGSGVDYRLTERSSLSLRASYTIYDHHELDENSEKFEAPLIAGSYSIGDNGPASVLAPNATLSNPANWAYRNKNASTLTNLPDNDNVYSLKADYDFNDFSSSTGLGFKAGLFWRRLDRHFNETYDSYLLPKGTSTNLAAFLPAGATVDGINPNLVNPNFWQYIETNGVLSVNQEQTADYHLVEDVFAGHAEVIYRLPQLRIMLGTRLEDTRSTDQTSDVISNVITPVKRDINYAELLPNAQALYDLRPNLRLRAAYTETIARPDFSDFAMGRTTSVDSNGYPVISGTNPYLKPRQSRNYDFSVDYDFRDGFASVGLFRKELRHEEFKELTQQTNASGEVILTETMPLNSGRARMNGAEITLSQDRFWFLPHPLDGLYANANYTRMEGVWKVVFSNGSMRDVDGLRNQPTWLGNLTAGYRLGPIDVSTSVRWRGRTFTGTFGTNAAGDVWYEDYTRIDAHASYKLNSHLSIFVEGRNLNNAYLRQTTGLQNALLSAVDPGPSGFVGVKFRD